MDAGCDGDNSDVECPAPVSAVGLYLASTGTVWQSYACDHHAKSARGGSVRQWSSLKRRRLRLVE
jgi:hypothetical protein